MSEGGQNRQLPRWMLVAAVIGSGALTGWAMWRTQATGPESSWNRVETAVGQVWAQPGPVVQSPYASQMGPAQTVAGAPMTAAASAAMAMPVAGAMMPGMMMPGATMVARVRGAPTIVWGTNRPHGDRGTCTQCHTVVQRNGRPVPMIMSSSGMPHGFRGVCGNCHGVSGNGPVGPMPVAMPVPTMGAMAQPGMAPQGMAPQRAVGAQPAEVEWRGLETRAAAQGVMVTNVDGTAQRAGVMPGDVIVSLNGEPVTSMAQLERATMNGNLPQGTIIVRRNGQRMAFELRQGPGVGIAAPGGMATRPGMVPGAMQPMAGM